MKENQIVDIDGFVHVVNGKVICFKPDVLDIMKEKDRVFLMNLAAKMFVSEFYPKSCGDDTMAVLTYDKEENVVEYGDGNMKCLSKDVQQKVRKLVDEYESRSGD